MRHPARKFIPQRLRIPRIDLVSGQLPIPRRPRDEMRRHPRARLHIIVFVILRESQRLLPRILHAENIHPRDLLHLPLRQPRPALRQPPRLCIPRLIVAIRSPKERRHLVKIPLRPLRQRVIVALRARHIRPEESRQHIRDTIQRHLRVAQKKPRRPVLTQLPIRRQHILHERIPRAIRRELILQPVLEKKRLRPLPDLVLHPEKIRQPIIHIHRIARRIQQHINQLPPLVRRRVFQIIRRLLPRRHPPHRIEIHPPHELLLRHRRIKSQPLPHQRRPDQPINLQRRLLHIRILEPALIQPCRIRHRKRLIPRHQLLQI